jgi:alkanesulfonate monooxygenase SsuD/methylene tetrahydromethanopterin reductase-like flavin-dependent oxidoreductase (luciferase family)
MMQFGLFYECPNPFTTYGNSPAPLLQALYIGQRTRRLKIGTAAVILPVWQPLPLAEEVAVLDNLIDGRFLCGIGRGYQPYAMAGFGDNVGESRQRFQETLEVLLLDDKSLMDRLFCRTPRPSSPSSNAPPVWT